jgi:hypothetical protein
MVIYMCNLIFLATLGKSMFAIEPNAEVRINETETFFGKQSGLQFFKSIKK